MSMPGTGLVPIQIVHASKENQRSFAKNQIVSVSPVSISGEISEPNFDEKETERPITHNVLPPTPVDEIGKAEPRDLLQANDIVRSEPKAEPDRAEGLPERKALDAVASQMDLQELQRVAVPLPEDETQFTHYSDPEELAAGVAPTHLGNEGKPEPLTLDAVASKVRTFVHTVAAAKVDDSQSEKFQFSKFKAGVERLVDLAEPLRDFGTQFHELQQWQNKAQTLMVFLGCHVVIFYNLLVPLTVLAAAAALVAKKLEEHRVMQKFGFDILYKDLETREPRFSLRAIKDRHTHAIDRADSRGMIELITDIRDVYGAWLQLQILDFVATIERLKNLATWKRPRRSWQALLGMTLGAAGVYWIPTLLLLKLTAHFLVCQIFVLMPLQSHFPRYRRLFSATEWLLWDVPTDAEYALEQYARAEIGDASEFSNHLESTSKNDDMQSFIMTQMATETSSATAAKQDPYISHIDPIVTECGATSGGAKGKLFLHEKSIRFHPNKFSRVMGAHNSHVVIPLKSIAKIKKVNTLRWLTTHGHGVQVHTIDDKSYTFGGLARRDDIFYAMVAYAGGKWKRA